MAQFARPNADTLIGNYVDNADGTTNIFQAIDEESPNDADFIKSPVGPSSEVYVCALSSVTDPEDNTGHVIRWRRQKDAAGGETVNLTVQLRQGYVNEGTPGTLIAEKATVAVPDSWTTDSLTLSEAEAGNITDYTSLFLRFVANQV